MDSHLSSPTALTVVYLAYLPYGIEPVERFFASYREHPAGIEHRLVVVLKGTPDGPVPRIPAETRWMPDDCLDLGTYVSVARRIPAERLCFLNTSSVIRCDGWLEKLNRHWAEDVGIVGASGSWGKTKLPRGRHANPHIRTNTFMLNRELALSLDWHEPVVDKRGAHDVEHGDNSLTRQVLARGLKALVVGCDGEAYEPAQWSVSRTFWSADQENLLVSDNASRRYDNSRAGRMRFQRYAWNFAPPQMERMTPA